MPIEDRATIVFLFGIVLLLIALTNWRITWLVRTLNRRRASRWPHRRSTPAPHLVPSWPERED